MDVLPIPADMDFFSPDEEGVSKLEKPILSFAGRLDDPRKHLCFLFQSFAHIRKLGVDIRLHVTRSSTPELTALAGSHGRSDHFQCLGRLNRDELKNVYQFLALFINTFWTRNFNYCWHWSASLWCSYNLDQMRWHVRLCCTGCKRLFIWFWWCWNSQTSHQTPWKWRSLFELCKSRALKCSGNLCAKCVEEQFDKTLVRVMGCWYLTPAWMKLKTT